MHQDLFSYKGSARVVDRRIRKDGMLLNPSQQTVQISANKTLSFRCGSFCFSEV